MRLSVCFPVAVLAVAVGWITPAFGQGLADQPAGPPVEQSVGLGVLQAPVVIDGETLFNVRGVSAYPAERRAGEIERRIRNLARDGSGAAPSLTLEEQPQATWILANGQRVLAVYDEDAAVEAVDRRLLAEAYRRRIVQAIASYRQLRQPALLWWHTFLTLGATFALIAGALFGRRFVGWLQARLERRYRARVRDVAIQSFRYSEPTSSGGRSPGS